MGNNRVDNGNLEFFQPQRTREITETLCGAKRLCDLCLDFRIFLEGQNLLESPEDDWLKPIVTDRELWEQYRSELEPGGRLKAWN